MLGPNTDWHAVKGAAADEIARLRAAAPVELPESYYTLLAWSNGGEGPLPRQPLYFQLDSVAVALDAFRRAPNDEFFPGFVIFGSNGGGEYIAFDVRNTPPWPIVYIDMTNCDLNESVRAIAASFDEFLALVGQPSRD